MNWLQIRFTLQSCNQELLENLLLDNGALSITLEDAADQPILEPELNQTPVWDELVLTALFDAAADTDTLMQNLAYTYPQALPAYRIEILEDKDWVREWMTHYKPIEMADNLWVCPSWSKPPKPTATNIMLDPGLAFGTGTHPTTAMCLKALSTLPLTGKSIIDFGCGSGILAIAALLLGAEKGIAIDNDPQAIVATKDNAKKNGIAEDHLTALLAQESYGFSAGLVIANILANPLIRLSSILTELTAPNGVIILSGLLEEQQRTIIDTYDNFDFQEPLLLDGWCCLIGTKIS